MQKFTELTGIVLPLDRPNVDTDAIIPKQYLKSIRKTGFGDFLFDDWRYLDAGDLDIPVANRRKNPDFVLNEARYQNAEILLTRENFGCGSSREHAVWALDGYGIRCVIAPSFADIFYNNSFKSGLLPVILDANIIEQLFQACFAQNQYKLNINLHTCEIKTPDNQIFKFNNIDEFRQNCLLNGLDDIGLTLQYQTEIKAYEAARKISAPWLF